MAVCVYLGAKTIVLAASAFTLAWTHSVEKVRWEEDWRLTQRGLELVAARILGSGAGMEVPEGATFADGVWTYAPSLPPQRALLLARSGATGEGWEICADGSCERFGTSPGAPAEVRACMP
jgi:hypothetical protein